MADRLTVDRRDFLRLAGLGGVVFASSLGPWGHALAAAGEDFSFVQMSDTHWGFEGPKYNPEAKTTLRRAVTAVNALPHQPDFIVFTGDLTHTTNDDAERRRRLEEFKAIAGELTVKDVKFIPGEHDAGLDAGAVYRSVFGNPTFSFEHKGVHFVTIDNVSDPTGAIGDTQLQWLQADLAKLAKDQPIVVFTHRPLFDLYPQWDWATKDGAKALAILTPFENVTVFYGHIHQQHHQMTGRIAHHSAESLIFPQPAPGSQPKRAPIPWDPAHPYRGLGFRTSEDKSGVLSITEKDIA
ncbi:MAG: metallophosphoesterase [Alphaproteobacteria bacterium]|nr:metallophosphoesterase [Alphaproteobacteria bacterium]